MTCSLPHRGGLWQGSDRDPIRRAFRKRRQTPSLNPHAGCLWKASSRNRRTHDIVRDAAPPGGVQGLPQDKPAREVEAERPAPSGSTDIAKPVPARTTTGARRSSAASSDDVLVGVTLSRPDKVLWPDDGKGAVTKLDLARYSEDVGKWMMGHLLGRRCSIIRAPDGIGGRFFQRHSMKGGSNLLEEVSVSDDRKPYVQIDKSKVWPP